MISRETTVWVLFGGLLGLITALACGDDSRIGDDDSMDVDDPKGACVRPNDSEFSPCSTETQDDCVATEGDYKGDGTSCDDQGSCVQVGLCFQMTRGECGLDDFEEAGNCPTGACLGVPNPDGSARCEPDWSTGQCRAAGGTYEGDGSECPEVTGACCFPDGTCEQLTPAACEDRGGSSHQPLIQCADATCPDDGCAEPMDISGVWIGTFQCVDSCGGEFSGEVTLEITQNGETASYVDDSEASFSGTVCGNVFEFSGGGEGFTESGRFVLSADGTATKESDYRSTESGCTGHCDDRLTRSSANGRAGGVPDAPLSCAKDCMEDVSVFLAACVAQGNAMSVCAPTASQMFQDCLNECSPGCEKDCMTESSAVLAVCLAGGTPLEACLGATRVDFSACLANCPARGETDCLSAAATQVTDCLLAGSDPVECGQSADAFITACLEEVPPPPPGTAQLAGDCNQDGSVNVADVTCLVRVLFRGFNLLDGSVPEMPCATAGGDLAILDVSANEVIDVADIVGIAGFLFGRGAAPPGGAACQLLDAGLGCPGNPGCR